jgi:hypothetical protein
MTEGENREVIGQIECAKVPAHGGLAAVGYVECRRSSWNVERQILSSGR